MAALPAFATCLLALLTLETYQGVEAIDCYDCVSVAGSNLACEDKFRQDLSTVHLISRDCKYDLFPATHCFKVKGLKKDGSHFIVRSCSDDGWGSNCGAITYVTDDGAGERISGCLTTCNFDGCNSAPSHLLPSLLPLLAAGILAATSQTLLRLC
ncbi:uncharacterized protein LOC143287071 [Babylonia areolata]|uniref:uncharacterized protein LOC143287071 n=1 Tax=Babylonia areolata TaxID=304850 RepID=UPI003FD024A0